MTPPLLSDADERLTPRLPLPRPSRPQPEAAVTVRGLRFTRRDVDRLADMLACGIEPAQLLREARMALTKEGL